MQNSIDDLNDLLFQQAKMLGKTDMNQTQMGVEVKKALALSKIATNILNGQLLKLKAVKMAKELPSKEGAVTYARILNTGNEAKEKPIDETQESNTDGVENIMDNYLNGGTV